MSKQQPSLYHKALVSYLYFIQGIFLVIPGTTILTYKQMPSYGILSLFSAAILPFSVKFLSAPLIEKYTISSYGRRKTWAVLSLMIASVFLIISASFTAQQQGTQKFLALFLTFSIFMISLEDISTDALAVKELNSAELASYLQCIMQSIGGVVGSLLYLQLVTGSWLSPQKPLLTVPQYFYGLSILTFISALIIHFTYVQKKTKQQEGSEDHTLLQVIKHYKYFVNPKYRPCRQALTFLLYIHGLVYFSSSYTVQLIKNNYISKDLLTTLQNLLIIPVFFVTSLLSKYWSDKNLIHKRTRIILAIRLTVMMIFFFSKITDTVSICFFFVLLGLLSNAQFFLNSILVNSFQDSKFSGMYVSMMGSFLNFGNNSAIQLKIINNVRYETAIIIGFCYTILILISFGWIQKWIKRGIKQQDMQAEKTAKLKSLKIN